MGSMADTQRAWLTRRATASRPRWDAAKAEKSRSGRSRCAGALATQGTTMSTDTRAQAAKYYDLNPDTPVDIPFYRRRVPFPEAHVLELGCGTGRVLVPLAEACGYLHGLDLSEAMVAECHRKLEAAGSAPTKAQVEVRDITNFVLNQKFDLIIAPYRVLQNLETDTAVTGLFHCIRQHLTPGGSCILNVFRPYAEPEVLRREWCREQEMLEWKVAVEGGYVTCHDRRPRMDLDKMILYPELIYRRYQGETLVDEATLKIAMRCYYPDEFVQLIERQGFRVLQQWGGYNGEVYGQGSELVVQFTHSG
jgi:SAM-dependent methyltransferase